MFIETYIYESSVSQLIHLFQPRKEEIEISWSLKLYLYLDVVNELLPPEYGISKLVHTFGHQYHW